MKYIGDYTSEISFPLGGIGTGCVGLGGNGRLMDWEIFNRPSKGSINGYSHFAIKAVKDNKPITFVLNGDLKKDFMGQYNQSKYTGYGRGPEPQRMCGFPHFRNVVFDGEFPIATLNFKDDKFPADVTMTAFNPFIPNDSKNSSIPAAFFEIEVTNTTEETLKYQIALSVANPYISRNEAKKKDGTTTMPEEMVKFFEDHGLKWETTGDDKAHNYDEWRYNLESLTNYQESISNKTQTLM
ncbi:MAG: GH116 family glycosyl-hydrolase, partial [Eubacteriales bacterium]